jgi:plastocyanin
MDTFARALASALLVPLAMAVAYARAEAQEITMTARVQVAGEKAPGSSHLQNVVVWLRPSDSRTPTKAFPERQLRLTQHHKSFEPHLLVVPVGAVVEFPNRDPFFHNVFSLFEGKRFDLGLYEAGTTRDVSFDRQGVSYIFCNIHAEMSAVVIALDTPYFGVSNRNGEIVIPKVPVGQYTMKVWYEAALPATLDALTREVNVTPETSTLGVLQILPSITVNAHKNKYGMDYEPPAPDSPGYDHR